MIHLLKRLALASTIILTVGLFIGRDSFVSAQAAPPVPAIFSGPAKAGGEGVPDGWPIVARIGNKYESEPVRVTDGQFRGLLVGPTDSTLVAKIITFYLDLSLIHI